MTRALSSFLMGFCAFATAHVGMRLLAPFAGLGLTLYVAVLSFALIGFGMGAVMTLRTRASGPWIVPAANVLIATAAWTLAITIFSRPLLELLNGFELRGSVALSSFVFVGLPCAGLGLAFGSIQHRVEGPEIVRSFAAGLVGAGIATPLVSFVLLPWFGLTLVLASIGAAEALVALMTGVRKAPLTTGLGVLAILVAAGVLATRPARAAKIGPRMLEHRLGLTSEYRVFDRDGARYLLADGSIQAVMDTLSGDCVQRGPAALELLKIFRTGRESMLVLGLRGGTLPLSFARSGWRVSVVEPDGDAVRAARRVSYRPGEMQLFVNDPRLFVLADPSRYSVIVVDAFSGSEFPSKLCTREFVQALVPRLQPGGLAIYSIEAHGWGDPLVSAIAATLRTGFAHVVALPTSEPQTTLGTVLLIASAQPLPLTDEQLPDPTTFFQNPDALWVVQQQLHAWLNRYEPPAAGARVITDDRSRVEVWADRVNHAARKELHLFFGPKGGSW